MQIKKIITQRWFRFILLGTCFISVAWLLRKHPEQLELLQRIEPLNFFGLLLINLLSFGMTATASWHLLRVVGTKIRWRENLALTFLANFLNYFAPAQPGLGAKAIYLKQFKSTSYTDFTVLTATNALMMMGMTGLTGMAIVAYLRWREGLWLEEIGLLSLCAFGVVILIPLLVRFLPKGKSNKGKILTIGDNAVAGLRQLWNQPRVLAVSALIILTQYAIAGLSIQLSYAFVGEELGYTSAFLIATFLAVANLFPLTPNNIGVAELVFATAAQLSGGDFSTGLVAAGILRAYHLLICVAAIPYTDKMLRG